MDDFFGAGGEAEAQEAQLDEYAEAPQSGVIFTADQSPSDAAPAPVFGAGAVTGGAAAAAHIPADDVNPLIEFNKQFRAICEEKDAVEREAKGQRRTAGKQALKQLLSDRAKLVDSRKSKNREDEAIKEKEMVAALSGEPWTRLTSLIDVHGGAAHTAAAAAAAASTEGAAGGGGKKKVVGDVSGELGRMKDVLIAVKNAPPPTA